MGRPPIGKVAMTGAERVRRYRLKHGLVTNDVTKPDDDRVRVLEAELAGERAEIERLKAELARERREKAEAKAAPAKPPSSPPTQAARRAAEKRLRAELRIEVRAEIEKEYDFYVQNWKQRVERADRIIAGHQGVISRKDFRIVLAGLHPDLNKFEQARDAFETFQKLEDVLVKPEAPVIAGPPLPSTVAELLARKKRKRTP